MNPQATSVYEVWVLELQEWAKDPARDLTGLPRLSADSLPPSAYERLIGHIMAAQQQVMSTWQRRLERNLQSARSEHDYARALVELRALLGRRLQLAASPALPPEIQQPLREGVERDVRRIQQDLETAVTQAGRRSGIQRGTTERMLRLVRTNSFTAILQPDFPLHSLFQTASIQQAAAPSAVTPAMSTTGRDIRRRVILDDG